MAAEAEKPDTILREIRWPLRLTRLGMVAETVVQAFWPVWSIVFFGLAFLMLGLHDMIPLSWVWGLGATLLLLLMAFAARGISRFHLPTRSEALARLDATMPGNPILASLDTPAIGQNDPASLAVWRAHQQRMRARLSQVKPVEPDLRAARLDPYALRYVAVLALVTALLFGSVLRVQTVAALGPSGTALASGPSWEGWLEPPYYTGLPSIYLNDIETAVLDAPVGSTLTFRFYGEVGALSLAETVSGGTRDQQANQTDTAQEFEVRQTGTVRVVGSGGREWSLTVIPDEPPQVFRDGEIDVSYEGEAQIPFKASDDNGVSKGEARFELALDSIDRRYGLALDPEPREPITVPLPTPVAGARNDFSETLVEDFSQHPWANLPVTMTLSVEDEAGQRGVLEPEVVTLPGRRFFDPLAAAVIDLRRALLWNRDNAPEIAMLLRAISHRPEGLFRSETDYLRLRTILRRIEGLSPIRMNDAQQAEIAQAMWELALRIEEGDIDDALERLHRAQERLAEAMKNGASDQEIAELMQELRRATDDYLRQLSRQAQQQADQNRNGETAQNDQNTIEMSQSDLQAMMDRIQELMEQGRMAEAQEALDQLRQMMENMQVTQGQGQPGQSPGEQAMEGLADTLREQQGLSDQAFRDLQEQFNPDANRGQSQNNEGRDGQGQGRGAEHGQGQGNGAGGEQPGQGGQGGDQNQTLEQGLADRQQALRQELNRQRQNLPGAGTEAGDAAREALGRAEGAMEGAEGALRENDLPEAIDKQAEAMEALREGMRNLGEALAQNQQNQGQQGVAEGTDPGQRLDPLGRSLGSNGQVGTDENLLQGEDVYRRARELLDEIRRRTGEGERPAEELDYLERLLDRF